jgi:hypothetical protein
MAIELLIEAPAPQAFTWNYEAIKEAAIAKAKEYQGIIYADADEAAMKRASEVLKGKNYKLYEA